MMYAVIKKDGTFAGRCCDTIEAARELARQESGRRVYTLIEDKDIEAINSMLEDSKKVFTWSMNILTVMSAAIMDSINPQEEK